ncbi:hypothetical protein [uncultured Nocardioides sp.]|uniref:hypothetical protein n=1 Tax=uncultured Nocardioides sp. TaxID=198441 RepID=UPI003458CAFD
MTEAAERAAALLVRGARESEDDAVADRLLHLADTEGIEAIAEVWSGAPAETLAGCLWRLYLLRQWVHADPVHVARAFEEGRGRAQVARVVAGVADPPGPDQLREMVDEVLRGFLDWLFDRYQQIVATEPNPLERLKGLFMASFEAVATRHAEVVIYQDEAKRLSSQPRFAYVEERNRQQRKMWVDVLTEGIEQGLFRPDVDVDLVYRFIRDTTWVSVRWYQPGGPLTAEQVGQQYLSIVLGGITTTQGD